MQLVFLKIPNIWYHINREYASVAAGVVWRPRHLQCDECNATERCCTAGGLCSFILLRFGRKKQLPMKFSKAKAATTTFNLFSQKISFELTLLRM